MAHIQLLPYITGKNKHKRQRNAQPRHLNGGVELVAGKESQITFHNLLFFKHLGRVGAGGADGMEKDCGSGNEYQDDG